jgi:hypothetical protein
MFKLEKAEIWVANLSTKGTATTEHGSLNALKQKVFGSILPKADEALHPWVNSMNSYNLFRSRSVFMVPSHLTMKQITETLLYSAEVPLTNK